MYEFPRNEQEWKLWQRGNINLVRCGNRQQLDEAHAHGMRAWVSVPMVVHTDEDETKLRDKILDLKDHPAIVTWEAPDEAIWAIWKGGRSEPTRPWMMPEAERSELYERLDNLVVGLIRGAGIIRSLDQNRKLWLNEAVIAPLDILSRCAGALDVVGFDYYPIPERWWRPMNLMGPDTGRFRAAAPDCELWIVQQAFSWSNLPGTTEESGGGLPNREQYRFMAWQAIAHGATGLLWWGSRHEPRPAPFLEDLMATAAELNALQPFLTTSSIQTVQVGVDYHQSRPILGCTGFARRAGDETLLVIINQDSQEADAVVTGLDWVKPENLVPVGDPSETLHNLNGRLITPMGSYETRLFTTDHDCIERINAHPQR